MTVSTAQRSTARSDDSLQAQSHAGSWETVNRVVFPVTDEDATLPLYAIEWTRPILDADAVKPIADFYSIDFNAMSEADLRTLINANKRSSANTSSTVFTVDSRTAVTVHAGQHASFCTYFNAFPASYWRRWTNVSSVRFTAMASGNGEIMLMRSSGRGLLYPVESIPISTGSHAVQVDVEIPMDGLLDGGFFWFDAKASDSNDLHVEDAQWSVPVTARRDEQPTTFSIAITTFNRASYCLRQLCTIADDTALRARLDTIYCVDQGTDHVCNQDGFNETAQDLGKQLTYIQQANLGGSGGFSRGMFETLRAGTSSYTMLLDDDAISEPESIIRAVQFADYCVKPTIVGGGMFHLDNRTVLYAQSEIVNRNNMRPLPAVGQRYNHDYAQFPLRDQPFLHRRFDADFNGWWMCLIPTAIMKDIGLSLPVFIKYDDFEFGLRAQDHGYTTVSLPGVAVWHQAWHNKDTQRSWEDYFNNRNRWICLLLHADKPTPQLVYQLAYNDVTIGLRLAYSSLHLHHLALRDVMRGPQYILSSMPTKLAEVREARKGFSDTETRPNIDDFPPALAQYAPNSKPESPAAVKREGITTLLKDLISPRNGLQDTNPAIAITAKDATWRAFRHQSSALVTSADGNSVAWCKRDNKLMRTLMFRNLYLTKVFCKRFNALAEEYRAADLCSIEQWAKIFNE